MVKISRWWFVCGKLLSNRNIMKTAEDLQAPNWYAIDKATTQVWAQSNSNLIQRAIVHKAAQHFMNGKFGTHTRVFAAQGYSSIHQQLWFLYCIVGLVLCVWVCLARFGNCLLYHFNYTQTGYIKQKMRLCVILVCNSCQNFLLRRSR